LWHGWASAAKAGAKQQERGNKTEQTTCKPGSVSALPLCEKADDDYSSGMPVTKHLMQPTRTSLAGSPVLTKQLCPYMVLLRMGFTLPGLSPAPRCALTAPFHPYQTKSGGLFSVALSLGSPPLDVIQHPDPVKPGLSSASRWPTAAIRSSAPVCSFACLRQRSQFTRCSALRATIPVSASHLPSWPALLYPAWSVQPAFDRRRDHQHKRSYQPAANPLP